MTPDFFYVFNLILSFSTCSQSFNKICVWEVLGANVFKSSRNWMKVKAGMKQTYAQLHVNKVRTLFSKLCLKCYFSLFTSNSFVLFLTLTSPIVIRNGNIAACSKHSLTVARLQTQSQTRDYQDYLFSCLFVLTLTLTLTHTQSFSVLTACQRACLGVTGVPSLVSNFAKRTQAHALN